MDACWYEKSGPVDVLQFGTVPFNEMREAHKSVESGAIFGRLLVEIGGSIE